MTTDQIETEFLRLEELTSRACAFIVERGVRNGTYPEDLPIVMCLALIAGSIERLKGEML
jgi:hypothetical protein